MLRSVNAQIGGYLEPIFVKSIACEMESLASELAIKRWEVNLLQWIWKKKGVIASHNPHLKSWD